MVPRVSGFCCVPSASKPKSKQAAEPRGHEKAAQGTYRYRAHSKDPLTKLTPQRQTLSQPCKALQPGEHGLLKHITKGAEAPNWFKLHFRKTKLRPPSGLRMQVCAAYRTLETTITCFQQAIQHLCTLQTPSKTPAIKNGSDEGTREEQQRLSSLVRGKPQVDLPLRRHWCQRPLRRPGCLLPHSVWFTTYLTRAAGGLSCTTTEHKDHFSEVLKASEGTESRSNC